MRHVAVWALAAGLALVGAACGASSDGALGHSRTRQASASVAPASLAVAAANKGIEAGRGPFAANGDYAAGPGSGLWGDTASTPDGDRIGCLVGRRYADAVTLRNRSKEPVTLTGARGPDPAQQIIDRVAVQLRLTPPRPKGDVVVTPLRPWSAAPTPPVTIPPGRDAVVQSNFLMRHCEDLALGQTLVVGGSLVLSYRSAGHVDRQEVAQRSARIILTRGPTIRSCRSVAGSASLVASEIGCTVARRAALACRHLSQGSWGMCSAAGHVWNCGLTTAKRRLPLDTCWLVSMKSHWFRVRWTD